MQKLIMLTATLIFLTGCPSEQVKKTGTADPSATPETVNLLAGMKAATSQGIMFGHQDDLAYGKGWVYPDGESDVKRVCGDYPAVYGMDLGHIEHLALGQPRHCTV